MAYCEYPVAYCKYLVAHCEYPVAYFEYPVAYFGYPTMYFLLWPHHVFSALAPIVFSALALYCIVYLGRLGLKIHVFPASL